MDHAHWPGWRAAASYGMSAVVMIAIAVISFRLVLAPIHGVHDQASCVRAYATARTHRDSIAVDFLSYPDRSGQGVDRRCGYVRPAAAVVQLP